MKQSMYQVTEFPDFGDSIPASGKAFSILYQGMCVDEIDVGKFSNKLRGLTEKFSAFSVCIIVRTIRFTHM